MPVTTKYINKDAWIDSYYPNYNGGTDTFLNISGYTTRRQRAYCAIDIPDIPAGSIINSARFAFYVDINQAPPQPHRFYRTTSPWTELGVTWNNQPSWSANYIDWTRPSYLGWLPEASRPNLASLLQDALNAGQAEFAFVLKHRDENLTNPTVGYQHRSREYAGASHDPYITVDYTPPTPPSAFQALGDGLVWIAEV